MEKAERKGDIEANAEGSRIARELFDAMQPLVAGLQIKASEQNFGEALNLLNKVKNI